MNAAATLSAPPFARELTAARRRRDSLNVFIHAGDHAWRRAKLRRAPNVLCLPPDADFDSFNWSVINGLAVTLVCWNWPPERVDAFARHLVLAGASLVAAIGAAVENDRALSAPAVIYKPAPAVARVA